MNILSHLQHLVENNIIFHPLLVCLNEWKLNAGVELLKPFLMSLIPKIYRLQNLSTALFKLKMRNNNHVTGLRIPQEMFFKLFFSFPSCTDGNIFILKSIETHNKHIKVLNIVKCNAYYFVIKPLFITSIPKKLQIYFLYI